MRIFTEAIILFFAAQPIPVVRLFCGLEPTIPQDPHQKTEVFMEQTYMKERPVLGLVIKMSLPMVVSMLVNSLYNIIDSFFVAKISEDAMTTLSLVYPIQNLINSVAVGFGIGINAAAAFFLGEEKQKAANSAVSTGILLSAVHGILLTVLCTAALPSFLGFFTDSPTVTDLGIRYANIAIMFSIIINIGVAYEKIYQSVGRMTVSMAGMMLGCVANIILDPLMIFGIGPFPELGIEGAAIATGIGQTLTLIFYIAVYFLRPIPVKTEIKYLKAPKGIYPRLYSVGIPASLNMLLPSVLISALNSILAAFAQSYVLVLGIYYKLQTFIYLTANGVVQGMRPLLGYNYGAGEHDRVRGIFSVSLVISASIMAAGTAICLTFPNTLIGLFTENPSTIDIGASALRIISIGFIISSVSVVISGALEGLGRGIQSLVISLLRYIAVTIPLAFALSRILGAAGVWHAIWITEFITAAIAAAMFKHILKRS